MFVRLVRLGNRAWPEDDGGNASLIDQVAHVAAERCIGNLAIAAAFGEKLRRCGGNDDVLALPGAVVVM